MTARLSGCILALQELTLKKIRMHTGAPEKSQPCQPSAGPRSATLPRREAVNGEGIEALVSVGEEDDVAVHLPGTLLGLRMGIGPGGTAGRRQKMRPTATQ